MTFQITTPTGGSDSLNFKNFSGTSIGSIAAADGANNALTVTTGSAGNTAVVFDNNQNTTVNYLSAQNTFGFKNRIINGAMVIDQRNSGASVTNVNGQVYTVDRFCIRGTVASKFTAQQYSPSTGGYVTPPVGFVNYLGITSSSAYSVLTADYFLLQQVIEGYNIADLSWGTANAKTVTLLFQVYSSLTGTFGGALENSSVNRCYPFSYSIPVANTWTAISVVIAGDTTGTWTTTNTGGITVNFGLGAGATYGSGTAGAWSTTRSFQPTGTTSVVGTNGATFYITGVQLEKGNIATPFEYRQYGQELALCQRYYNRITIAANTGTPSAGFGVTSSSTASWIENYFPVTMRATPTVNYGGSAYITDSVSYNLAISSIGSSFLTTESSRTNYVHASGATAHWPASFSVLSNGSAYQDFSAEL
jgi:hypothetical protein